MEIYLFLVFFVSLTISDYIRQMYYQCCLAKPLGEKIHRDIFNIRGVQLAFNHSQLLLWTNSFCPN